MYICEGSGRRVYVHGCDNRNGEHSKISSSYKSVKTQLRGNSTKTGSDTMIKQEEVVRQEKNYKNIKVTS